MDTPGQCSMSTRAIVATAVDEHSASSTSTVRWARVSAALKVATGSGPAAPRRYSMQMAAATPCAEASVSPDRST